MTTIRFSVVTRTNLRRLPEQQAAWIESAKRSNVELRWNHLGHVSAREVRSMAEITVGIERIQQTGFKHGQDGIRFYPPSCWNDQPTDTQERRESTPTSGYHEANIIYEQAYIQGREEYKRQTGRYPSTGETKFDKY